MVGSGCYQRSKCYLYKKTSWGNGDIDKPLALISRWLSDTGTREICFSVGKGLFSEVVSCVHIKAFQRPVQSRRAGGS